MAASNAGSRLISSVRRVQEPPTVMRLSHSRGEKLNVTIRILIPVRIVWPAHKRRRSLRLVRCD